MGFGGGRSMMGGHGNWGILRALRKDNSVKDARIPRGTVTRVFEFARPYRRLLAIFLVLIVFDAVVGVANPFIYRAIIDNGIVRGDTRVVITLAAVLVGLALLSVVNGVAERAVSARVGEGLIYDMRSKVFAHVNTMPIAFFTRTQTGALVSRLNNDVLGAQQAFTDVFSNVFGNIIGVSLVLVSMFILSWQITLASLVVVPLFVFPARRMGHKLERITREAYGLNAEMTTMMSERFNVAGALLVKIFGRPNAEREAFDRRAGRVRDIGITQAMYARILFASLALIAAIATALVYGWGGVLAIHHGLTLGTIVAMTAFLNRLYGPLTQLSNVQVDVLTALVSFDRVFEVLDLPPMIAERPDAVPIPPGPVRVEFDHVDFAYPGAEDVSLASLESVAVLEKSPRVPVLHDVNFAIEPGQLVALVGPSGAGKTTIGALVCRLYDADGGAVRINGLDVRQATLASLQEKVAIVTQDAHLFHDSVRANLLYARPEADEAQLLAGARGCPDPRSRRVASRTARHHRRRSRLPALGRGEAARGDRPAAAQGTRRGRSSTRRPPTSTRSPRRLCSGRSRQALVGRTSLVIAHRLSTIRNAEHDPRPRGRQDRRARAPRSAHQPRRAVQRALPHPVPRRVGGGPERQRVTPHLTTACRAPETREYLDDPTADLGISADP